MVSDLGVTEISDLKLETDLRLKLSYNCWVQVLERFRRRSLSAKASANRADGTEGSSRAMRTENLNWQDMRLVRIEGD